MEQDSTSTIEIWLKERQLKRRARFSAREIALLALVFVSGIVVLASSLLGFGGAPVQITAGILFTLFIVLFTRRLLDPDVSNARQFDDLLDLASQTLACMEQGLNETSAQQVCALLLPATRAIAVAITDKEKILGYVGYSAESNLPGSPIRTMATHEVLETGEGKVILHPDEMDLPAAAFRINAAIITPLYQGDKVEGTLKFYYRKASHVTETQRSIAHGFGELLSTQIAAAALEEQTKLATSMELKALQAQINPHFLFNTINTIASLIRTDPNKARELLREFAVFYRSTLEDSVDLIPLERELQQVERYFSFQVARFGEDRLSLIIDVDPQMEKMLVPSFMIQPLVENSVGHAMKSEGKLTTRITGGIEGDNVVIRVIDDGAGMDEETLSNILHPTSSRGLGIAVKNVQDRMRGYFGPEAHMDIESVLGEGTTVTFSLKSDTVSYIDAAEPTSLFAT